MEYLNEYNGYLHCDESRRTVMVVVEGRLIAVYTLEMRRNVVRLQGKILA
jgi:hypothetical protein